MSSDNAAGTTELPPTHKDPLDRLLISQATIEAITLLITDKMILQHPGPILAV